MTLKFSWTARKVLYGVVALFLLGAVVWLLRGAPGVPRPKSELEKAARELERPFREDPYGGNTPEETIQLFVGALRKGDTELASKYFSPDKQEEWAKNLKKIKARGLLGSLIEDVLRAEKIEPLGEGNARYEIKDPEGNVGALLSLNKNPNGKWKIMSL